MQAPTRLGALTSDEDWRVLREMLEPVDDVAVLRNLLSTFRELGARAFILEEAYIDRDFSAAHAAFYAALFHPYLKYCRRLHFLGGDTSALDSADSAEAVSRQLQALKDEYLGFVVLRPLQHAPVGFAVVSSDAAARATGVQIELRSDYPVHVLGADLTVRGFPLTQQDRRLGACAQAVIWMAGRHFHSRHGGPWFSLPDINEVALKPTDNLTSLSLPAGSEFLTSDNIVRALRAMERHPVVHAAQPTKKAGVFTWGRPPHEIVSRYLDSGVPVILGLRAKDPRAVGHAVVAVGRVVGPAPEDRRTGTWADFTSHILVNDDQLGAYQPIPVRSQDRSDACRWTLEDDLGYLVVPLPAKVFMPAEVAETLARDCLATTEARIDEYWDRAKAERRADLDPEFFGRAESPLIARTYLTHGWKYKRRALRNRLPARFKWELLSRQLPRYVWVTEFSLPADLEDLDPARRRVRAHVVVDATGSPYWDSVLVVQLPGLGLFWGFDPGNPAAGPRPIWRATEEAEPFLPKVRGWSDYDPSPASEAGQP